MSYILALDQGTTSSRAIVFDHNGAVKAIVQKELATGYPQTGWVEQDPNEIWTTQYLAAQEVLASLSLTAVDVTAIGITNQRETTIVWDRSTGQPIYNAIVWQDRRTSEQCETLRQRGIEQSINQKTGLRIDPYFSATKIQWILEHVTGARQKAERGELAFGTVDSWLIWKLTSGAKHLTDVTNASRTSLFNIKQGNWDDELLNIFRIPRAMLPQIMPSSNVFGETSVEGFSKAILIAGVAGDQQAALFGQRCARTGMVKNTYGTGCFMLMHTGSKCVFSSNKLLTTLACKLDDHVEYALEGSVFIGGAVIQWLRDGLGIIRSSPEVESLAKKVADNGGVYFVPAFVGLGAPHWDPHARGAIIGLDRASSAAHIARAALEGIAFQVADVLDAMRADAAMELLELRVDGGAAKNDLLMQMQADFIGVPVLRPRITETTALGAAYLAGLATSFWRGPDDVDKQWQIERIFEPCGDRGRIENLRHQWHRAVGRARGA